MERLGILDDQADSMPGPLYTDYRQENYPWEYLGHKVYGRYQRMHKMLPGEKGAKELEEMADQLAAETDPHFLSASGSAYLESAIARDRLGIESRLILLQKAQMSWEYALRNEEIIRNNTPEMSGYTSVYRIAMNLACLPMVRSMLEGNVTEDSIMQSANKLMQVGDISGVQKQLALQEGNLAAVSDHNGMQHEINALLAFIHQGDPRFIAIPSSDRAGTGFFYRDQTHDITVISQHFGEIRNIIPVEVKASASKRDRERYKALIIRGKMHLSVQNMYRPEHTRGAFRRYMCGEPSDDDLLVIAAIQSNVSDLVTKYKQGGKYRPLYRKSSKTSYYNSDRVASRYVSS